MEALFLKLVNMSITASWLVLAIIALRFVLRRSPRWLFVMLWGLVALRLLCPFSIESTLSMIPSAEPLPQEIMYTAHPEIHSGIALVDNAVNPVMESGLTPIEPASANPTQIWSFILSQLWILGVALMFLYATVSFLLLKRKVATAIPMEKGIKQSEFIDSPFVLGFFRPVIYLPFAMSEGDMAHVIAHEKAHICRRDHWWKPFGFLLLSIYWFNPVLWLAYILLCRDIEAACDERVIRDMDRDGRRAYSTALLNCSIHRHRIAACPLAFGETGVKARVTKVMNYKKPAFWIVLTALLAGVIVAVCFLTNPEKEEEIPSVYTWFDRDSSILEERRPKETLMPRPGMDSGSVYYDASKNEVGIITANGVRPVISGEMSIRSLYLTDLTGDGVSDICAMVQTYSGMKIQAYDMARDILYTLPGGITDYPYLSVKAGRLCVIWQDADGFVREYGQLALDEERWNLVVQEPAPEVEALTKEAVSVDIWTRTQVDISTRQELERVLSLLHDLEDMVQPATEAELAAAKEDTFYTSFIEVKYALGKKSICFSKDFSIVWDMQTGEGYRISDPEPLREYVRSVTRGVRDQEVSGIAFAGVDAPWDWCAGISSGAVESAHAHVCLYTYARANTSGSTATMGHISYDTLDQLTAILNRIPREAFTPRRMTEKESYHHLHYNQSEENTSVSIVDGVNGLAALISLRDGELTLLLTDEMEKIEEDNMLYLEPTQVWLIQDEALLNFMKAITEHSPVITYFVGSEYDWQDPLTLTCGNFTLNLRLIEGWEYERITDTGYTGIRCRPANVTSGWLTFSFWPEGYEPEEENRYISAGYWMGMDWHSSYPAEVSQDGSLDLQGAVWSYQRVCTPDGDFAIINEGADSWFLEYQNQIDDTIRLSELAVE